MNMRGLIDLLNYHTKLYDEGKSIISDEEWDKLYFMLQKEEKETGIIYPDSPTQSITYTVVSELNKIQHEHPMLSLDKTKEISEIENFIGNKEFVGMFKLDGLSCSLTYINGELIRAETRGNGLIGEDIMHNARVISTIPQKINYTDKLVVDGEIICDLQTFNDNFKNNYKNARNFAAGSIRLLNSSECKERKLTFVAWDMIEGFNDINSFNERLNILNMLGFTVVPHEIGQDNINDILEFLKNMTTQYPIDNIYPVDGYVFKFDDVAYGKSLGQTEHHFRSAIAFKTYDESYSTRLKYITWTMGKTGVLTPVAVFDPIEIDGSTVEKASLHNYSIMKEILGECAYKGEPLEVIKANMIIPQIVSAGPKLNYGEVIANCGVSANDDIEFCPICNKPVNYVTSDSGVINIYCDNPNCEGKIINTLESFCGKKGLDIKGISKATFQKLIDWEWLTCCEDIFKLKEYKDEWIKKDGFGIKSVEKILNSIEESKNTTLEAFLAAINIPLIGVAASKQLAKIFGTYDNFRKAVDNNDYKFYNLDGFGIELHNNIKNFDFNEADTIAKKYIKFKTVEISTEKDVTNSLKDINIVITGKLQLFKNRDTLIKIIEENGGKVVSAISSKTNLLINNDINSNSSKNLKAKSMNIPIISEKDFIEKYHINLTK